MRSHSLQTFRPNPLSRPLGVYIGLVIFSIAGSLLSGLTHVQPGPIAPIAAAVTLLCGLWALLTPIQGSWSAVFQVLLFGMGAELIGISTGYPFGAYQYTNHWWPVIPTFDGLNFPLLVPFAWVLVAGASHLAVGNHLQPAIRPLVAGLLAALCDLVMEPVMTGKLDYWTWTKPGPLPGGAPILNFLGWWLTAAVASWLLQQGGWEQPADSRKVLALHLLLILSLAVIPR